MIDLIWSNYFIIYSYTYEDKEYTNVCYIFVMDNDDTPLTYPGSHFYMKIR